MNQQYEKVINEEISIYFYKSGINCKEICCKTNTLYEACFEKCMMSSYLGLQALNNFFKDKN
jgi:hypothetical protein